jgi:hypothetical protein
MRLEVGDSFMWITLAVGPAATDARKLRPLVRVKGAQSMHVVVGSHQYL